MSIYQLDFNGNTKVDVAIKRLRGFEPKEGYYLAFSGGKDSCVIKALADMAGVRYDAHYNVTSVDPPELVKFIKEYHPDVKWERKYIKDGVPTTMWNLIENNTMPPTRTVRYCCKELKEWGGEGRFVVTGVRHAESSKRKQRGGLEIDKGGKWRELTDPDNPDNEEMVRICSTKGKHILNPIIDWEDGEVWEFIKDYSIPYCKLYDEGFKRLGCIGCPMGGKTQRNEQFEKYPKYKINYIKAFDRMLKNLDRKKNWESGADVLNWWVNG